LSGATVGGRAWSKGFDESDGDPSDSYLRYSIVGRGKQLLVLCLFMSFNQYLIHGLIICTVVKRRARKIMNRIITQKPE